MTSFRVLLPQGTRGLGFLADILDKVCQGRGFP